MQKTCNVKMSPVTLVDGNISAGVLNFILVMVNGKIGKAYY
jgi:hypothetical protein